MQNNAITLNLFIRSFLEFCCNNFYICISYLHCWCFNNWNDIKTIQQWACQKTKVVIHFLHFCRCIFSFICCCCIVFRKNYYLKKKSKVNVAYTLASKISSIILFRRSYLWTLRVSHYPILKVSKNNHLVYNWVPSSNNISWVCDCFHILNI